MAPTIGPEIRVDFPQTAGAEGSGGPKEVLKLLGQYLRDEIGKSVPGKGGSGAVPGKGGWVI